MNKIPMAVAVALVIGTPLAFAADSNLPSQAVMTTQHCTNLETSSPINGDAKSMSSAKAQAAEEQAMSLCRWDWHKDGGIHPTNEAMKSGTSSNTPLLLVRH